MVDVVNHLILTRSNANIGMGCALASTLWKVPPSQT
jgi:hypothetical protein